MVIYLFWIGSQQSEQRQWKTKYSNNLVNNTTKQIKMIGYLNLISPQF